MGHGASTITGAWGSESLVDDFDSRLRWALAMASSKYLKPVHEWFGLFFLWFGLVSSGFKCGLDWFQSGLDWFLVVSKSVDWFIVVCHFCVQMSKHADEGGVAKVLLRPQLQILVQSFGSWSKACPRLLGSLGW